MRKSLLLVLLALAAAPVEAREAYGVRMPDTVTVEGRQLKLNGMGLRRKKFLFAPINVYVAGFYVETPSKDAIELISSDQAKRITIFMLRDLGKDKIADALREGFEKNAKAQLPVLKERLENLIALIPDAKKGSTIVITYAPGIGTMLARPGDRQIISGKDFADALFSVWLGREPVDSDLKAGLLGDERA
ncbi:MAG TPA: chalcone isomerase family protein [Myxococcaceae bacterium]|nr:chalcone isomerase family protein [Myxococcaceae bacterium]